MVARELPHSTVNSVQVVLVLGPAGEADPAPRVVALGLLVKRTLGLHVLTHRVRVQELRPTGGAHSILKQNQVWSLFFNFFHSQGFSTEIALICSQGKFCC